MVELQRDVFYLTPVASAVGLKVQVASEEGSPLLEATSPGRVVWLVLAPVFATAVFLVVSVSLTMVVIFLLRLVRPAPFDPVFIGSLVICALVSALVSLWVLSRLLCRRQILFRSKVSQGSLEFELRLRGHSLGFGILFELRDGQASRLATLHGNALLDSLFRRQWRVVAPDGSDWFIVREDTRVPRAIRMAFRTGVGIFVLAGLLIALIAAAIALAVFAQTGVTLLLYTAILAPLAVLYLVTSSAAFVLRKLLPRCLILEPDRMTPRGTLQREMPGEGATVLDLSADGDQMVDRRVAVALAVMLMENA